MNLFVRSSNTKRNLQRGMVAGAIAGCLLLSLPGCHIPCLRGEEPSRELPETYNGEVSGENSSQVSIDEFFNDPILTNLIHEGLYGNFQLKILAEDIQIANNEVLKRRGAYLPFITLGGGARLDQFSKYTILGADNLQNTYPVGNHFPTPYPDFLVAGNFSWQIDVWRQLRNARDAAGLRYLGTTEGRNYVVTRLVAEIAENYYGLLALDRRMENLDRIIVLQEASLERAKALKEGAQGNELGVQRFLAEVRKNQSEKLIIKQDIIEVENRINFLVGRYPEPVDRSVEFFNLNLQPLKMGVPSDLLRNRPDIRQAELEVAATGLDIKVARANFYPRVMLTAGVGYDAFNAKYLFMTPETLIANVAGDLVAPLVNKRAIQAEYMNANAKQLQALYDYQRTVLNAFTEVINRISMVQNYTASIEIKQKQLDSLEASVDVATKLFQGARVQYMDVLFAQRDLMDARMVLIETKKKQLSAVVNTYQALGGGLVNYQYPDPNAGPTEMILPSPVPTDETGPTVVPPAPDKAGKADKADETDETK
jgi:multidrug efflux system outer membrane protein